MMLARRIFIAVPLFALLVLLSTPLAAETPQQDWVLGRFTKNIKAPIALLNDYTDGCPDESRTACIQMVLDKQLLTHQLLLGEKRGDYRFVHLFSDEGSAYGWLAEKHVRVRKITAPTAKDWAGTWISGKPKSERNIEVEGGTETFLPDSIILTKTKEGKLAADGTAYWYGPMTTYEGTDERVVNFGSVKAAAKPSGTKLTLREAAGCEVTLQLISKNLMLAADNGNCGGMNVHFSGVFMRDDGYDPVSGVSKKPKAKKQ